MSWKRPPRITREWYGTPAHPRCINCGEAIELGDEVPLRARGHYRCKPCEADYGKDGRLLVLGGAA